MLSVTETVTVEAQVSELRREVWTYRIDRGRLRVTSFHAYSRPTKRHTRWKCEERFIENDRASSTMKAMPVNPPGALYAAIDQFRKLLKAVKVSDSHTVADCWKFLDNDD